MGIINDSLSSIQTAANYAQTGIANGVAAVQTGINNATQSVSNFLTTPLSGPALSGGSIPSLPVASIAVFAGDKTDTRVKLKVPQSLLTGVSGGENNELLARGGIIFPYTPTLSQDYSANWGETSVTHSNFKQYSYKNSSAGLISLSAEFTVQNETDAYMYLSVVHLLRLLTKMKWGSDVDAGAPPPICRLMAYGTNMFDNIPVAVQNVRIDLPKNVDYLDTKLSSIYGVNSVPVLSTIAITLIPVYSRDEQLNFSVDRMRFGRNKKGYV